jgi:hypothetical protein
MKKLMVVSALFAASTVASAFDYKINLEGKVDYINSTSKTTARTGGAVTEVKDATFTPGIMRLNMLAKVNEELSLRMRYRVNKEGTSTVREDSTSALDFFYVDHKNSLFTTRFGKQSWAEAFGREAMISGTDLMITSATYTAFNAVTGHYRTGVSAIRSFDNIGTFTVAVSNPNNSVSDGSTGLTKKNTSPAFGAYSNGSFMNKMIQPVLGYTLAPQDGDTDNTTTSSITKKANNTLIAYGLRSEVAGFTVDVDMKEFKKADNNGGTNTTVGNKETKTKSTYANVAYTINEFTPFVSYMNDKLTDVGTAANDYKKNTYAVGAWYKPFADVNFRYDLHYLTAKKEFSNTASVNSQVKDSKIYFGIKADI